MTSRKKLPKTEIILKSPAKAALSGDVQAKFAVYKWLASGTDLASDNTPWQNAEGSLDNRPAFAEMKVPSGPVAGGESFSLDPDRVAWNSLAAEGAAKVSSSGTLSWTDDTRGYVEAMIEVTDGAFRRASLTLGDAPNAAYVSLSSTIGGTATGGGQYNPGDSVTLRAEPDEGYSFDRWEIEGFDAAGLDLSSPTLSFTMPGAKIKVTAVFRSNTRRVINPGDSRKSIMTTRLRRGQSPLQARFLLRPDDAKRGFRRFRPPFREILSRFP